MNEQASLSDFFSAWELFRDPALAGTIAGALLGFFSVYVILRRFVFLSAAVSQMAGLGVSASFYAQSAWGVPAAIASPTVGATTASLAATLLLTRTGSRLALRRDAMLGLFYLFGAAGALALGTRIAQEHHEIESILFGSAVAVVPNDFWMIVILAVVVLSIQLWWMRGFILVSFDRESALVRRLPVRLLDGVFLISLALSVSLCTRVLGALPVFAFSVLPGMAAIQLSRSLRTSLLVGTVLGAVAGFAGYVAAFMWQLPVGAAQALIAAGFVVAAEVAAPILRSTGRLLRARNTAESVSPAPRT